MQRSSEPVLPLENYFEGTFQSNPKLKARNAMTLLISKKSQSKYNVNILWNEREFKNLEASVVKGNLHIPTSEGTVIFKPVLNGILQISNLNNAYDVHNRLLKTSNKAIKIPSSIVGHWTQDGKYSNSGMHTFTYLEDGRYFQTNRDSRSPIRREGTYRVEDEKVYYSPICGEEVYDSIVLNQSHLSTEYHGVTYLKTVNSEALSKLVMAQYDVQEENKKLSHKLTSNIFSKDMVYKVDGITKVNGVLVYATLNFKNNGHFDVYTYEDFRESVSNNVSGNLNGHSFFPTRYKGKYHIEIENGKESIVLESDDGSIVKTLALYDGRETVCFDGNEVVLKR